MLTYSSDLLSRFLNQGNQPADAKEYIKEENRLLSEIIKPRTTLIDFGCGFGRHLELLRDRLFYGLGIDINKEYILSGRRKLKDYPNLELKVADARHPKLGMLFDYAICMNNTLGNIKEKQKVIAEMQKAIIPGGLIIVGVYSENSINSRIRWYKNIGLHTKKVIEDYILTEEGFRSEHFTEKKLIRLFNNCCKIKNIDKFGYLAMQFKPI